MTSEPQTPRRTGGQSSLLRLLAYTLRAWKLLAAVIIFLVTNSLLDLAIPWVMGFMVLDRVIKRADLSALPLVIALLVGIFVAQKISDFLKEYFQALTTQRLIHSLRCDLYEHIEALPVGFFDKRQSGELLARITGDVDTVEAFISTLMQDLASQLVTLVGAICFLFAINGELTVFVLPTMFALAISVVLFKGRVKSYARRVRDLMGEMAGVAGEMISGVRVVKAFCAERFEARRFSSKSLEVLRARVKAVRVQTLYSSVVDACVLAGTIIVVIVASRWVVSGALTIGAFVAYLGYLNKIYMPVKKLSKVNLTIQKTVVAAERIFELMGLAPEWAVSGGRREQPLTLEEESVFPARGLRGLEIPLRRAASVQFEDVSFGYEPDRPVLKDFSLGVAPGEVVGLVGHSGGGKTTLVNLLLRFYEPASGRILIDGIPLGEIPLEMLRRQIAVVPQETFLFSGSIRDNIAYANPDATDEQLVGAARAAMAHDFIMQLPQGYRSEVGERGVLLSGGQRQRIAIARALLRNPRILIFDEATSHLDSESERLVQQALTRIAPGRTVFVIAHRLSSISWVDKIVVLEEGEVVEIGTHEELLAFNGVYCRLYSLPLNSAGAVEPVDTD